MITAGNLPKLHRHTFTTPASVTSVGLSFLQTQSTSAACEQLYTQAAQCEEIRKTEQTESTLGMKFNLFIIYTHHGINIIINIHHQAPYKQIAWGQRLDHACWLQKHPSKHAVNTSEACFLYPTSVWIGTEVSPSCLPLHDCRKTCQRV